MRTKVTVSGSFRKHLEELMNRCATLEGAGLEVLSPRRADAIDDKDGFVLLRGDTGAPSDIERRHLECIGRSDFLYVVNPDGYVGLSTSMEIGYAIAHGIPVVCEELPSDAILAALVSSASISELASAAPVESTRILTFAELAIRMRELAKERGFDSETPSEVITLLLEELGELARAVRIETGMFATAERVAAHRSESVGQELADCSIYLTHLANILGLDLAWEVGTKMTLNEERVWSRVDAPRNHPGM